jgi:phospholipid/cholesterol/gamma-HCH transport system substrate-binding protein
MAAEKDYTRLGLFLFLAAIVVLSTVLFFVQRSRDQEVLPFVTYTDQNVTGLAVQSAVRYKGVTIGRVDGVRLDTGSGLVEIDFEVVVDTLTALGGDVEELRRKTDSFTGDPDVRAQVVGSPITGEAHLLLDTPASPPPALELDFEPDRPYIPSMPSALGRIADQLPQLVERGEALLNRTEQVMARLPETLDRTDRFFASGDRVFRESQIPELSDDVRDWLRTSSEQLEDLNLKIEGLLGEEGRLAVLLRDAEAADLEGTSASLRETLDRTSLAADELRRSLPAIRASLEELRALSRLLEEQPEDLIYGRRGQEESR